MSRHLFLTADYPPRQGGQARYLNDIWGGLTPRKATILAPRTADSGTAGATAGPEPVRLRIPLGESLPARVLRTALFAAHALVRAGRGGYTAVHAGQVVATGTAALLCRKLLGLPYTLVIHGADLLEFARRPVSGWLVRRILSHAGIILRLFDTFPLFNGGDTARICKKA